MTLCTPQLLGTKPQIDQANQILNAPPEVKQQSSSLLTVHSALAVDVGASVSPFDLRLSLQAVLGTESRPGRCKKAFGFHTLYGRGVGWGLTLGSLSSVL